MKGVRMKHPLNPVRPTPRSPRVGHVETLQALLIAPAGVLLSPSHASFPCRFLPTILIPASALRSVAKVLGRRPPWWCPPRGRAAAPRARHLQHDLLGPWFPRTRPAECARSAAARGQPHCGDRCHCVGARAQASLPLPLAWLVCSCPFFATKCQVQRARASCWLSRKQPPGST